MIERAVRKPSTWFRLTFELFYKRERKIEPGVAGFRVGESLHRVHGEMVQIDFACFA